MVTDEEKKKKLKEAVETANKVSKDASEILERADKNRTAANTRDSQIEEETQKKMVENQQTDAAREEILAQEQQQMVENQNIDSGSLMDSFKGAMQYLGPTLHTMLIAGAGSDTGALGKAGTAYKQVMDFNRQDVIDQRIKKYQQVQGLRDKFGRPLKFDPDEGTFVDVQGNEVKEDFLDPISKRKADTDEKKFRKDVLKYAKTANDDFQKLASDSIKAIQAGKKAAKLINSNSKLAPAFAARALARLAGEVGVMTDKDVASFQGDPSLLGKFQRTYERAISGTMTAEDKKIMNDALKSLTTVEQGFIKNMGSEVARRMGNVKGAMLNQEELQDYLLGGFQFEEEEEEKPKANVEDSEIQDIFKRYGF